jgi:hypothetical protein
MYFWFYFESFHTKKSQCIKCSFFLVFMIQIVLMGNVKFSVYLLTFIEKLIYFWAIHYTV